MNGRKIQRPFILQVYNGSMSASSVSELIPILQIAIGPVILISGIGLLLLSMTNRIGRAIDRARILSQQLRENPDLERQRTLAQIKILARRANLLRQAIILASLSLLLAAVLIIALFLVVLFQWNAVWLLVTLFIGCMLALIGSLLAFIQDVNHSLEALKLDLQED
jgi:hypothetical protein